MVTLTAKLLDRPVRAEVYGPHDVGGDAVLLTAVG